MYEWQPFIWIDFLSWQLFSMMFELLGASVQQISQAEILGRSELLGAVMQQILQVDTLGWSGPKYVGLVL